MKKIYSLIILFLLVFSATAFAQKTYTISLQALTNQPAPALQSFALAESNGNWLVMCGRTNGFHGTNNQAPGTTFPESKANKRIWVINKDSSKTWSAPLPSQYIYTLSATNTQSYQNGDTLYICGGYGLTNDSQYVTYPNLSAIRVSGMINAIMSGDTTNLDQYILSIQDTMMQVTGGELLKMNNYYYLVMGQKFTGEYNASVTGAYTDQVRKFSISSSGTTLKSTFIQAYTDSGTTDANTQFHRRDLNVIPVITPDGQQGITVLGGVFTQIFNGPFQNPVEIYDTQSGTVAKVDTSFLQQMSQYHCGNILIYNDSSKAMYCTLLGGISFYEYKHGKLIADANMPWITSITTIIRDASGTYTENVQPENKSLPGYIGAEGTFVPSSNLLMSGSREIIDFKNIPASGGLIGYFYGGIISTKSQSSSLYPTSANNKIYGVYLSWN